MSEELNVSAHLTNEKVQFTGTARSNPAVVFDYSPPLGDGQGYTGLEMLLMSLAACSGTSVVALLRKMGKKVSAFKVEARGIRRDEHPTSLEKIFLSFVLNSENTGDADIQKAIDLSEQKICPVWDMLKGNVEIITEHKIIAS